MNQDHLKGLSPEQIEHHNKWGHEFYFEPYTGEFEFSQVRTNMMEDRHYTPYCIPCPGNVRYGPLKGYTMKCPNCGNVITWPKEFIERFNEKHGIK